MSVESQPAADRWFAVIPAAGRSVRMGQPKLLLPVFDGQHETPLILKVIGVWKRSQPSASAVVATVHPDDDALARLCREAGAEVVQPAVPPPDMKASIAAALQYLEERRAPTAADVWLTAPADLPELSPGVIVKLLQAYDRAAPQIIRPMHADRFGHPTLLPWSTKNEVGKIPADRGLDYLFERLPFAIVEAGPECLAADVDTPADYRRLHDR